MQGQHLTPWAVNLDQAVGAVAGAAGDGYGSWEADWAHLHSRSSHHQLLGVNYLALKWRIWHRLIIKFDTQQMGHNLLRLEVNLELGITLRLNIIEKDYCIYRQTRQLVVLTHD